MIDPKTTALLQEQISTIESSMMDRAIQVFDEYEMLDIEYDKRTVFNALMKIYNNYCEALIHDIVGPIEAPNNHIFRLADFVIIIKRLNKGYANFVYDTTKERLIQFIQEEQAAQNQNESNGEDNPQTVEESSEDNG